jgi:Guanosine polyphosphate pyrophosphohydrolases/synthetases
MSEDKPMGRIKYEMHTDRSGKMNNEAMLQLKSMFLAPYMQLATALIGKARHAGGNMFRHQLDTMAILIDYGYIDSVLLKASVIHDVVEDVPGFDKDLIVHADDEGPDVYRLVLEVTKKEGQLKNDYLRGIIANGSQRAKVLKCADRISNMISLGFVTDPEFIERYCDETEYFILPIALEVDYNMYQELINLIITRRKYLEDSGYIEQKKRRAAGTAPDVSVIL